MSMNVMVLFRTFSAGHVNVRAITQMSMACPLVSVVPKKETDHMYMYLR